MPQPAKLQADFRAEASTPEGAVPIELILCTDELHRRPSRAPDFDTEKRFALKNQGPKHSFVGSIRPPPDSTERSARCGNPRITLFG